jgi:protease-4
MTTIYQLFLARIAEGRNMPADRVAGSAEGRIFGGREAKARGLVDELGGLREAIARARTMAGLAADARFAVAGETSGFLETLADDPPRGGAGAVSGAAAVAATAALATALRQAAPELAPFLVSLAPLVEDEPALCALPFALTVR